ncbi:MAG: Nif3-like dinuclear metal center hexameric protein [Bacteroidetes bacterium]|nr:Nif3-like dinuclear metal center hexameric protein [Bacteroidota bacterium]
MKLKEITGYLDSSIPLSYQEDYDNSGLQVGDPDREVNSALIALDVTDEIIEEAVDSGCDLIISHHPLIFSGIKRLSGRNFTEKLVIKAVKGDIAVYSAHTNLDIFNGGVSRKMAEKLNLQNVKVLSPLKGKLLKLVTYIPENYLDAVRESVFEAGAGVIGNYDYCGFVTHGTGSYRGNESTNPFAGEKGKLHFEKEIRFETILLSHLRGRVIRALLDSHPYEEVAYDIYSLENNNVDIGLGCTGELNDAAGEKEFLELVRNIFGSKGLRHSKLTGKSIKKIALCGGSGASLLREAISSGADAYITGDIKYHNYFDAESKVLLVDAGHYETEKFSSEIIYDLIIKKFPKFAVRFSKTDTNPINYL